MPQYAMAAAAVLGAFTSKKSADKAADAQKSGQTSAEQRIDRAAQQARDDVNRLFPQAQATAQQGFQQAADVFGQTLPQQAQQFQGGNVAGQQALLAGLPQQTNAILGGPVDYSQFQPYQAQPIDFSFANQQIGGGDTGAWGLTSPLTGLPIPNQAVNPGLAGNGWQGPMSQGPRGPDPQAGNIMNPGNQQALLANLFGGG